MLNEKDAYKRYLKARGLKQISHYDTPKLRHPSSADMGNFSSIKHIWTMGDRFFKLAHKYYSDPELWWVVAFYNQKPTEFHVNMGEVIYIPTPLETVLFYMGY